MLEKRVFDIVFSILGLLFLGCFIGITFLIASIDTNSNGIFKQIRVGQFGQLFTIFKLRTIHPKNQKISKIGTFFRKYKIDEFPQFYNVLIGDMSFVGPRPDIQGYYDLLKGENRQILELKPGITGLASLKYAKEEKILLNQENPAFYNNYVIFPDKIKINLEYQKNRTLLLDFKIIIKTFINYI